MGENEVIGVSDSLLVGGDDRADVGVPYRIGVGIQPVEETLKSHEVDEATLKGGERSVVLAAGDGVHFVVMERFHGMVFD